jgi:hypothetical protein
MVGPLTIELTGKTLILQAFRQCENRSDPENYPANSAAPEFEF